MAHNLYDLFLYKKNYFVKLEKMPMMSETQMRFNKELFKAQTKCLFRINVVFGIMSAFIVINSYLFIQKGDGIILICLDKNIWQPLDGLGTLFVAAHQVLIMLQVKYSQYVLITIPARMKLFKQN